MEIPTTHRIANDGQVMINLDYALGYGFANLAFVVVVFLIAAFVISERSNRK